MPEQFANEMSNCKTLEDHNRAVRLYRERKDGDNPLLLPGGAPKGAARPAE